MAKELFTIGYSGYPNVEDFINELKQYGIQILIDVRSSPFSAYYENYNKDRLSHSLKQHGIFYFNYAKQFGARQEDLHFYKCGRLDFELFAQSPQFLEGIHSVEKSKASITLMCAEKHPSECHRAILISRAFCDRGHWVKHITPDGMLTQGDIEMELLNKYFPNRNQESLFSEDMMSEEEYIANAYRLKNDEIGFREEDLKT